MSVTGAVVARRQAVLRFTLLVCFLSVAGCIGVDPGPTFAEDPVDDPQLPPRGDAAVAPWLAAGYYLEWACEPAPHDPAPRSAHRTNRICSNALHSASTAGSFPVGAVSVKELYEDGEIRGYAVARKLTAGTARDTWYWYERDGGTLYADSTGEELCADCHEDAPRDHVFVRVDSP